MAMPGSASPRMSAPEAPFISSPEPKRLAAAPAHPEPVIKVLTADEISAQLQSLQQTYARDHKHWEAVHKVTIDHADHLKAIMQTVNEKHLGLVEYIDKGTLKTMNTFEEVKVDFGARKADAADHPY